MERAAPRAHSPPMPRPHPAPRPETPAEAATRRRDEAALLARAEAELDAGLGIGEAAFEAWLDALNHDPDAPPPVRSPADIAR